MKPLHDRIIVKRQDESKEKTTPAGLYIPDVATEKPLRGEVIAVGPGRWHTDGTRLPMGVKVGDIIMFGKYTGQEVKDLDDNPVLIMREDEVFAVL